MSDIRANQSVQGKSGFCWELGELCDESVALRLYFSSLLKLCMLRYSLCTCVHELMISPKIYYPSKLAFDVTYISLLRVLTAPFVISISSTISDFFTGGHHLLKKKI